MPRPLLSAASLLAAFCWWSPPVPAAGQTVTVEFAIPASRFRYWDVQQKQYVVEPGRYQLYIGAAADDLRRRLPVQLR